LLLAGRIRVRAPAFSGPGYVVRLVSGDIDGAADRHGDPAIHPDARRRADRHPVGHDRAGVVRQRIRHLPDAPVLPDPARRTRGSGDPRRLLAMADLLAGTATARKAG